MHGKTAADSHRTSITPMGYVKIPPKLIAALGFGPGSHVEMVVDLPSKSLVIKAAPELEGGSHEKG